MSGEQAPAPTRGRRAVDAAGDSAGDESGDPGAAAAVPVEDMVPREDIGDRTTGALLAELADKNWKVRPPKPSRNCIMGRPAVTSSRD